LFVIVILMNNCWVMLIFATVYIRFVIMVTHRLNGDDVNRGAVRTIYEHYLLITCL